MREGVKSLRFRYVIFVAIIGVITVFTQVVIHEYLQKEYADAGLINIAGRQRMLSQRITKLSLFIQKNLLTGRPQPYRYDSLRSTLALWKKSHEYLLGLQNRPSEKTDSLMAAQTKLIDSTSAAAGQLFATKDPATIERAVLAIEANDIPFLMNMQRVVADYQRAAEGKISKAERMEYFLAALSVVIISAGFFFIVRPSITRLTSSNHELSTVNAEMIAKEEEIRANFDQIIRLQSALETREKQYRERVEEAVDIIYEISPAGYYTYVNPSMVEISGYTSEELLQMNFGQLIAPEYRKDVAEFYEQQIKAKKETIYREFPVIVKSGKLLWIAQTIRVVYIDGKADRIHAIARDTSALRESQSNLVLSEKRFKSFAENSPVGIYELNATGQMTYINLRFTEITGVEESDTQEERLRAIHDDDRDEIIKTWRSGLAAQKKMRLEFRYIHPDKGEVWVVSHAAPIFDDDWKFNGYIGTISDITERKITYEKLLKSETTYKLISNNSRELITLYKSDDFATRTFISPSVKTILGYEPEELVGKSPFEIIHPDDLAAIRSSVFKDVQKGKAVLQEYRTRKKDGSYIWMETSTNPFFNEAGVMIGFQSAGREITERKRIEKALAEREELYRLLSENSRDLIALHTLDNSYRFVSGSFTTILGYLPEEMIGRSPFEFIHPEDAAVLAEAAKGAPLTRESLINFEFRIRKKDQTYLWVETYLQPITDEDGKIVSIQTSSRDISLRKIAESELKEARTRAEEANKAKSQFLSMMSHEIRTPMNAVIGLTKFMMEDGALPHQMENFKLLQYSGDNLLAIINDILDFSKIEAGKMELDEASFDLVEMLDNNISMMQHRAKAKDLDLQLCYSDKIPKLVVGDAVRINQVLVNLVGNSIKFTEKGQVTVDVDAIKLPDDIYELTFSVTDTGIGIEKEKSQLIFESFSQASKDTTRKFGGTGLGLAITKRLVNLMGSDIHVESELGKGSKFWFRLKLKIGHAIAEKTKVQSVAPEQLKKDYKILLVEDNPVNQIVAKNFLKRWAIEVTVAGNGKIALDKIVNGDWDLVLMDMQMPEMDGYEATKRIRAMDDDWMKRIPIIALTASAISDREVIMQATGLTDYITKPFLPDDLHDKVFHWLQQRPRVKEEQTISLKAVEFNNPEDAKVLASFMIKNLQELIGAFDEALDQQNPDILNKAIHKSRTTLVIINDTKFTAICDDIDNVLQGDEPLTTLKFKQPDFTAVCSRKIEQLNLLTV